VKQALSESVNEEGVLRRKPHIRRALHRRAVSDDTPSMEAETITLMPTSPIALEENEGLSPLIDSLTKLYADRQHGASSSTIDSEERGDSPSSDYGSPRGEAPILQAFVNGKVATFHDWDNGVHYRDARTYGVPEGRLLPKRTPTIEVKDLLRARRKRAGLSVDPRPDSRYF